MSSQPPMGGHLAIHKNDILYTNVPPMSSHLHLKATFPVSQGWLLIAGSTVLIDILYKFTTVFADTIQVSNQ